MKYYQLNKKLKLKTAHNQDKSHLGTTSRILIFEKLKHSEAMILWGYKWLRRVLSEFLTLGGQAGIFALCFWRVLFLK